MSETGTYHEAMVKTLYPDSDDEDEDEDDDIRQNAYNKCGSESLAPFADSSMAEIIIVLAYCKLSKRL